MFNSFAITSLVQACISETYDECALCYVWVDYYVMVRDVNPLVEVFSVFAYRYSDSRLLVVVVITNVFHASAF